MHSLDLIFDSTHYLSENEGAQVMNELGIERLSVFGMPPVEMVTLAADLGCSCIGIGLTPIRRYNPHGYSDWSLRDDPRLRREMSAAMRDLGVRLSLLEGFGVVSGQEMDRFARDLDILCELGGERINVVSIEPDLARAIAGFAKLAEMAQARGLLVSTEIGPGPVTSLASALDVVRGVSLPNFSLLIDTMHYFRFGGTVEGLGVIDPSLIGYVQLCDVPLISTFKSYTDEAFHERMVPGEGELPLQAFVSLLPKDVVVSLEVPRRALAQAGAEPIERVRPCVEAARSLLSHRRL